MKHTFRRIKITLAAVFALAVLGVTPQAQAGDLPLAGASPLAGITFDDLPFFLPVEVNFRMAMLAVSSELGRSCGKMEAYGWHMGQTEQNRVNQIFNNTVEKLRTQGYVAAPEYLKSAAKDITVFTADRSSKHLMFLWSASDLGLVLNICETSVPVAPTHSPKSIPSSVQVFPMPMDVLPVAQTETPKADTQSKAKGKKKAEAKAPVDNSKIVVERFSPIGEWVGNYTCSQGFTGGALKIESLHGKDFEGVFKFYPTEKNLSVSKGSYAVYGQFDSASKRILINPGEWIKRPKGYYNTVIVGSFDPVKNTLSAYFQGITGCTSFEADRDDTGSVSFEKSKKTPAKKAIKKKKTVKKAKAAVSAKSKSIPDASAQTAVVPMDDKKAGGIDLTPQPAASTSAPPFATPAVPADVTPGSTAIPAVTPNTVPLVAKPAVESLPKAVPATEAKPAISPDAVPFVPSQALAPSAAPATTAK
ncbi:MAG: hypothetical protein WC521_04910 [Bdellovibrionales bacterium]|jgi:hypothetical protein